MKFFLDHDVPGDLALLLRNWRHEATVLRDVLPFGATDEEAFAYARERGLITITCNRADDLGLGAQHQLRLTHWFGVGVTTGHDPKGSVR